MNPIFHIIQFTKRFWKWYVFMGLSVILISLLSLVGPLLSKQIVDDIVKEFSTHNQSLQPIALILGIMIATDVAITVLTAIIQWIGDIFGEKLETFLSRSFYQHVLSLHFRYYYN